jgi:tetratricopeptide (TPR) repeat protein
MPSIETYIRREEWGQAQKLIRKELELAPDSHWLWASLSLTYHEQHEYDKAMECAKKAFELDAQCPLVLWHYAGCLYMQGLPKEAVAVWKRILRKGLKTVAFGHDGEGVTSARRMLNDCIYRIGRCYAWMGNNALARRYFQRYLANRKKGTRSGYKVSAVKKELAAVASK